MTTVAPPVLLSAADAATYAGVQPVTLRVWRHRYRLTEHRSPAGTNLYALDELAEVLARRADEVTAPVSTATVP